MRLALYRLFLLGSMPGATLALLGLVHCGQSDPPAESPDAAADVAATEASSLGDSTVLVEAGNGDAGGGPCDSACTASQFCTGTTCDDLAFVNLCANRSVTVVDDPYAPDDEAGASIGEAVAASCPDAGIAVSIVPQTQPGVLLTGDAGWQPNTGAGTTLVVGGGSFGQLSVAYMDQAALTPVYLTNDGTISHIVQRATGLDLVTANDDTIGAQHDFFFLELAVEPRSGTLCLFGEGLYAQGTVAAGYFTSQVLLPHAKSYPAPWYVYEWTDTNGDMTPDGGDAFQLVAMGP